MRNQLLNIDISNYILECSAPSIEPREFYLKGHQILCKITKEIRRRHFNFSLGNFVAFTANQNYKSKKITVDGQAHDSRKYEFDPIL